MACVCQLLVYGYLKGSITHNVAGMEVCFLSRVRGELDVWINAVDVFSELLHVVLIAIMMRDAVL